MKNFFRGILSLISFFIILGVLFLGILLGVKLYSNGGQITDLDLDELIEVRSISDFKNWYYGEVSEIVVGEPVVVESISYDRYAYQQLDETTQKVYDQLLDCVMNHTESISLLSKDVDVLSKAYEAMVADYGNLFWISGYQYNTYKSGDTVIGLDFSPKYTMDYEQRRIYQEMIDTVCDEWLSGLDYNATDYDKAKYIFEILINNVDYDLNSEDNQNIISVFINRTTVCQGYADAAWYLLNELDIPCTIITGEANGESHAWNLIYLDNAYYYMDVTWGNSKYLNLDNSTEKRINYAYLAMTTEELCQTHTITSSFEVPECLSNMDNYYVHSGLYFDVFDVSSIGQTLGNSYKSGEDEISIKFASSDIFNQVIDYFLEEQHLGEYCTGITSIYYILDDNANVITIQWTTCSQ